MRGLSLFLIFFITITINAQFKEYQKLDNLFNDKQFEKCIEQALKYNKKEPKELIPVVCCARANYELFKTALDKEKLGFLKQSLKYAIKIDKIDKKGEAKDKYVDFMQELKKSTLEYANGIFYGDEKERDNSKILYDNLAKIYNDTVPQFYEFHPELRKEIKKTAGINAQLDDVNKTDKEGRKQGFWKKVYPNGVVAYEVYFKDDKPAGTHKRYHESGKLMAKLVFEENGEWADAELFNDKEQLIAKGKYKNKLKEGTWLFFMDNVKVAEETYLLGKRNGTSKTFYKNGNVSEEKNWENDIENGVWRQYYENGKIKLETRVDRGVRNSVYYTYHPNGQLEVRGRYKDDHMDGDWTYYDDKGGEIHRITYNMGKSDQQEELDKIHSDALKKLEENKGRLKDPANYINNPNEYLKESGLR
ncbi:MAG: toxin-antitoxin system YwqK family antitoxin [Chloroflexia bacterium]|nr:toxin-antitoxin system YwqK family antitoxin [Chloroflexia bacterium]